MKRVTAFALCVLFMIGGATSSWAYTVARDVGEQAEKAMKAGDYQQAIDLLKKTLAGMSEGSADWAALTERLAICYDSTGQFVKAADEWSDAARGWGKVALDLLNSNRYLEVGVLASQPFSDISRDCRVNACRASIIANRSDEAALNAFFVKERSESGEKALSIPAFLTGESRDGIKSSLINAYVVLAVLADKAGKREEVLIALSEATSLLDGLLAPRIPIRDRVDSMYLAWHKDLQGTYLAYARRLRQAKRYAMAGFYYDAATLIPGSVAVADVAKESGECAALKARGVDAPE